MRWKNDSLFTMQYDDISAKYSSLSILRLSSSIFSLKIFINILLLLSGVIFVVTESSDDVRKLCHSAAATQSCSDCIKQHPDCAWCADSRTNVSSRCDLKSTFVESGNCAKQHLYSPANEVKIAPQHNIPLDGRRPDSNTPIQLEPQQVEIRLKPGDIVEVPFQYLHKKPASNYEVKDFTIQTSEFLSLGLQIDFTIDCHGEKKSGRVCAGVKIDERISFTARISLKDCSNRNLIAVSVGIYGYNTVSALFVTPLCGCECENARYQERRSPRCSYHGNLVCGVCACDPGVGGENCECNLQGLNARSSEELVNQCRESENAPVCSSKGKCTCGRCVCETDYIRGRFCECDSSSCPLNVEGRMCSGHGECRCGKCACERGFAGDDCACTDDQTPCTENGVVCSGRGFCECGKCACNAGWTGATCNVEQKQPGDQEDNQSVETTTSHSSSQSTEGEEDLENSNEKTKIPREEGDVLPSQTSDEMKQESTKSTMAADTAIPLRRTSDTIFSIISCTLLAAICRQWFLQI